jgi:RNA-directed DNA polymerase
VLLAEPGSGAGRGVGEVAGGEWRRLVDYYGAFYRSALYPLLARINAYLMRWLRNKYKRLRGRKMAQRAWAEAVTTRPRYFAHWVWVPTVPAVW